MSGPFTEQGSEDVTHLLVNCKDDGRYGTARLQMIHPSAITIIPLYHVTYREVWRGEYVSRIDALDSSDHGEISEEMMRAAIEQQRLISEVTARPRDVDGVQQIT